MTKFTREDALEYHRLNGKPGKVAIVPTKPMDTQLDLSLAYSPGVAEPVLEIEKVFLDEPYGQLDPPGFRLVEPTEIHAGRRRVGCGTDGSYLHKTIRSCLDAVGFDRSSRFGPIDDDHPDEDQCSGESDDQVQLLRQQQRTRHETHQRNEIPDE